MDPDCINYALYVGAQNTLNALLRNWTDDNEINRQTAETLLAQAMLAAEGL